MKQRKEWVAPGDMPKLRVKPDLHPRKIMICVWWDWEGMVHWEMLERNATVNKQLYIAQLHCVNEAISLKRPHRQGQTILLHDNAKPHVAQVIIAALQELKWGVLQHPPYSPDLAPTDYYLFCSLSNHMGALLSTMKRTSKTGSTNSSIPDLEIFGKMASTNWSRGGRRS